MSELVPGQIEAVLTDEALAGIRDEIGQAHHAPGYMYSAPEMLEREKQTIFMKDWLFVLREEEVPNPGDYVTMRILNEPIVVSRDANGEVNAFVNMCLHRGVEVVLGDRGNAKRFSCPYHAWTYDSAGKLIGAAHMKEIECFSPVGARMKPLKVGLWEGNVFVTFNPDPLPLTEFLAPFIAAIGYSRPGLCRLAGTLVFDTPCNWKLVAENFLDLYHLGVVHAKTVGRTFRTEADGGAIKLNDRGGTSVRYTQVAPTPEGKSLFGQLPWLTKEDEEIGIAGLAYMPPNFLIFAGVDVLRVASIWPTSPSTAQLTIRLLLPEEQLNDPQLAEKMKIYLDYQTQTITEDLGMMKSLQAAMASRLYEPGPLSKLECSIRHTANYLLERALDA